MFCTSVYFPQLGCPTLETTNTEKVNVSVHDTVVIYYQLFAFDGGRMCVTFVPEDQPERVPVQPPLPSSQAHLARQYDSVLGRFPVGRPSTEVCRTPTPPEVGLIAGRIHASSLQIG